MSRKQKTEKISGIRPMPLLMLSPETGESTNPGHRRFYDLKTGTTQWVPVPDHANCVHFRCFSSKGWLLTVSRRLSMSLVNPFTGVSIPLPDGGSDGSLDDFWDFFDKNKIHNRVYYVEKFAVHEEEEKGTNNKAYMVAIVYGGYKTVALWRSGDDSWSKIKKFDNIRGAFADVIWYKGEFYGAHYSGWIFACGFDSDGKARARPVVNVRKFYWFPVAKMYLVESDGKLLVVFRESTGHKERFYACGQFQVLQLNERVDGSFKVVKTKDLGGRSLFLGDNESFSIMKSKWTGCKGNCIYFTDDWCRSKEEACRDMGIYDLKKGTAVPFCQMDDSFITLITPMWVELSN